MASGQTTNYGLNQWQGEDQVLREEFNRDNQRLDGALAGLAASLGRKYGEDYSILTQGNYMGTGQETIYVSTGFRPRLVIIFNVANTDAYDYIFMVGDEAAQFLATQYSSSATVTKALAFDSEGFLVNYQSAVSSGFNMRDWTYHYVAFR